MGEANTNNTGEDTYDLHSILIDLTSDYRRFERMAVLLNLPDHAFMSLIKDLQAAEDEQLQQAACLLCLFRPDILESALYEMLLRIEDTRSLIFDFWGLQLYLGSAQPFDPSQSNLILEKLIRSALADALIQENAKELSVSEKFLLRLPVEEMFKHALRAIVIDVINYYRFLFHSHKYPILPSPVFDKTWAKFLSASYNEGEEWLMLLPKEEVYFQLAYQLKDGVNHITAGVYMLAEHVKAPPDTALWGSMVQVLPYVKAAEVLVPQVMYLTFLVVHSSKPEETTDGRGLSLARNLDHTNQIEFLRFFLDSSLSIFDQLCKQILDMNKDASHTITETQNEQEWGFPLIHLGYEKLSAAVNIGQKILDIR